MDSAGQLEQDVDFKWRNLRHCLGGVQEFVFRDRLQAVSVGGVEVNSFDQLHVVEERAERHKVWEADFVALGHLQKYFPFVSKAFQHSISYLNQIVFDFRSQQMFLHAQHDVLEVQGSNIAGALRILEFEGLQGALLVKVVEKL